MKDVWKVTNLRQDYTINLLNLRIIKSTIINKDNSCEGGLL